MRPSLLIVGCALLWGCGGDDPEQLAITVTVDPDGVTFDWNGRAVHEVTVLHLVDPQWTADWWVSIYDEQDPRPRREPTIVPPLRYGQNVDNAFTQYGPDPLVPAVTYEVVVDTFGWAEMCEELGLSGEGGDETPSCSVASGRTKFTL